MKRLFRLTCFLLAISIATVMGLGWTEPGLKLLVSGVNLLSGGTVRCGNGSGALFLSFQLDDVLITTPAAEIRLGRLATAWQLTELFADRLHVADVTASEVEIRLSGGAEGGEISSGPVALPKLVLPFALFVDKLTVLNARLLGANYAELTRIDHLSLGLSGTGSQFTLHTFRLRAPGYNGDLQGLLDTANAWYLELAGQVEYRDYGVGPFAGDVQLKGPLARLDAVVDLAKPARGQVKGQILDLPDTFRWTADLELFEVQLADGHEILPELLFTVAGKAEGEMLSYGGTLRGKLDYLFFDDVSVEIEVHGNEDQIEFPLITAANAQGKATLTDGLLSWKDDLVWHGQLRTEGLDPAMVLDEYPGALDIDLASSGQYGEKSGLTLHADFRSFSGMLRGYAVEGHGLLEVDPQAIRVPELLLRSGEASLQLAGEAKSEPGLGHWRKRLDWTVGLQLAKFDPALFIPAYPGTLNAVITSNGTTSSGDVRGEATIATLDGVVRGYPVEGKGNVRLADQVLEIGELVLKSGESRLQVTGSAGASVDIAAELTSKNLGEFLADGGGSLQLEARLSGDRDTPRVEAEATARQLSYGDLALESLKASIQGGLAADALLAGRLRGSGLRVGGFGVNEAEFALEGVPGKHTYTTRVQLPDGTIRFRGDGSLAPDRSWSGRIQELMADHSALGSWRQTGSAKISSTAEEMLLETLCLSAGKEKLCLGGGWSGSSGNWQAEATGNNLDLARLSTLIQLPEPLRGRANASVSASGDIERIAAARGAVEIAKAGLGDGDTPGTSRPQIPEVTLATTQFSLQNGSLKLELGATLSDNSGLKATAEIPGFGVFAKSPIDLPLKGTIQADLKDLAFVAPLSRYYVRPTGALQGNLKLTGTVGNPVASGRLILADGQLELPTLGITMENVTFELTGEEKNIHLLATASSGPGSLQAEGSLTLGDGGVAGDFRCTGVNFDTARLPEYELRISPDLRFIFDTESGNLVGTVDVPRAVIAPERMTDSVSVSDDVIYLDGDQEENGGGWQFSTSLRITLGDDVRLDGYGVTGYLRGDLQVDKTPGSHMRGRGQLSLADGIFSIYGRTLSIERSRLLFAGGPVANPGVDVRAKKIVADNKRPNETLEVGVEVSGTADNLAFSLFSNPPMEESDILAYMVVGRAMSDVGQQDESLLNSAAMALGMKKQLGVFDELTGLLPVDEVYIEGDTTDEMSLVVGKHLTDELFIGYGHNFFEQEGEVRLRYHLGAGFSVETRSSGEKTGADLLYSFER